MDFAEARHLLNRTGFGATPAAINRAMRRGRDTAVKYLLDDLKDTSRTLPLDWAEQAVSLGRPARRAAQLQAQQAAELSAWWVREMIETTSPLTERLALFWHSVFTASLSKAPWAPMHARQIALFRKHAGGDFKALLLGVTIDAAYLVTHAPEVKDGKSPGEGFVRALLDATLGPGGYKDADVEGARSAFTGWGVDPRTGFYRYDAGSHDDGTKAFLGRSGQFNGTDIVNLLLEDPRPSERLTARLGAEFIGVPMPASEVTAIANQWRQADYDMKALLGALLMSEAFMAPAARGGRVKSPLDLLVGTIRTLYLEVSDHGELGQACAGLGQALFDPPEAGWPSGTAWLTTDTLEWRHRWLRWLLRESGSQQRAPSGSRLALNDWLGKPKLSADRANEEASRVLLTDDPLAPPSIDARASELLLHLVLDPSYQLI